jgi:soluble lytic murein transglycosylase-like protein
LRLASCVLFVLGLGLGPQITEGAGQESQWEHLLAASDPTVFTVASPSFLVTWASRYEGGQGVNRDYARARQLYCAAARRGHVPAQVRLARMYAHGIGLPEDPELAAAWLRVAKARGSRTAKTFLAVLGQPPSGRQPRCTYSHREERYVKAVKASLSGDGGVLNGSGNRSASTLSAVDGDSESFAGLGAKARFDSLVREAAQRYQLEPALIHAVITVESAYDPEAVSHAGAVGLMQLMPATAQRYGVEDPRDPVQNIDGGVRYLRDLLSRFESLPLAIAAYHAGETAVANHDHEIPPYPATQAYVRNVLAHYGQGAPSR